MQLKWLISLIISIIIMSDAMLNGEGKCSKPLREKKPCINGKRIVKVTTYIQHGSFCKPFISESVINCINKKEHCKCSAIGDPHYRTYDGQVLHFYGDCKYTLTKLINSNDICSFNIEVQNEYRGENKYFTYTKSVIIHMFGNKYELGQHRLLKVNNLPARVPYFKDPRVKIFHSHQFIQFVATKCSVNVAFDGNSNAFVDVSKKYASRMTGICGNCNGKPDDFKTKWGQDVSKLKNKDSLIGNSYNVSTPHQICVAAKEIEYENVCGKDWIAKMKSDKYCGGLLTKNNPFHKCIKEGHVEITNFYNDCVIDLCVNKNRAERLQKVRCEIFAGLAEVCAESGFGGIKWRNVFNCPMECGKNQHFSLKANSCPQTCENHLYGTKNPCYDLPDREGCECNKGYIRDGTLCVKPSECKCINICADTSPKCKQWKNKGYCSNFQELMKAHCPKTCGMCKNKIRDCEDELSTKKCLQFRNQGLCIQDFYRSVCGLTCNYEKCKCPKDQVIIKPCNKTTHVQTTIIHKYARDSKGRCAKITIKKHKACYCHGSTILRGKCNYCTGKLQITRYVNIIVNGRCIQKKIVTTANCNKCSKKTIIQHQCIAHKLLKTKIFFYKLIGCFRCEAANRFTTKEIKCKSERKEIKDKATCKIHIEIIKRYPVNCRCHENIIRKTLYWCCNKKPVKVSPFCSNRKIIHRTIYYKFQNSNCVPVFKDKIVNPVCRNTRPISHTSCQPLKHGKFYCKAVDTIYKSEVGKNCKCELKRIEKERTCCCKPKSYKTHCNKLLGILTTYTSTFTLARLGYIKICREHVTKSTRRVFIKPGYRTVEGPCGKNCLRLEKTFYIHRDGCEIKRKFIKQEMRLCCCSGKRRTDQKCYLDYIIINEYIPFIRNNKCTEFMVSNQLVRVICPPTKVTKSKCVYPGNKREVKTVTYVKHNCKCISKETITYENIPKCERKELNKRSSKCNSKTCLRSFTTVYRDEKCDTSTKTGFRVCCCFGKKLTRWFCNQFTGIPFTLFNYVSFNSKLEICTPMEKKTIIPLSCKKIKTTIGKCDRDRKGYIKTTTVKEILWKSHCKCKTVTIVSWKVCKCPPKKLVKRQCRNTYYSFVELEYHANKDKTECVPTRITREQRIICSSLVRKRVVNINKCKYKVYQDYYKAHNCKCKLVRLVNLFYRCCENKPIRTIKCVKRNQQITSITTFKVSADAKSCIPSERRIQATIVCKNYVVVTRTKCKNLVYWSITQFYDVVNCKCIKRGIKKRKVICDCYPIQKVDKRCINGGIKTTTTTLKLINEKCIASYNHKFQPTRCLFPTFIRGKCNRATGKVDVIRNYYIVDKCKCVLKKTKYTTACDCFKKDQIVRKFCDKNGKRKVEILRYNKSRGKTQCQWTVIQSFLEDCRCPRPIVKRNCVNHSLHQTKITTYRLLGYVMRYVMKYRCVPFQVIQNKAVVCNKDFNTVTCRKQVKHDVRCAFKKVNCKCIKSCRTVIAGPCQCSKLNNCKIQCIKNLKYSICFKHKPGKTKCEIDREQHPIRESCLKSRTICENRPFHREHGWFKTCRRTYYVYQGCRCFRRIITFYQLVSCDHDRNSKHQCIRNRNVVITTSYYRLNNACHSKKSQHFIYIDCSLPTISVQNHACSTQYKLSYYVIEQCKCVKKTSVKHNLKCCKKATLERKCIRNSWLYIHRRYQQKSSGLKLFPNVRNSPSGMFCQELKKEWNVHVICKPGFKITTCNTKTDKLRIEIHTYVNVNCLCQKKITVKTDNCKRCPRSIITRSKCGPKNQNGQRYLDLTIKSWIKLSDNSCKETLRHTKKICECQKSHSSIECKNGLKIFKTVSYNIQTVPPCKPTIKTRTISIPCYNRGRENLWRVSSVSRCTKPGQFTISKLERFKFDPKNCLCKKEFKNTKTAICCRPCHYSKLCRNTFNEEIWTCHKVSNLQCKTDVRRKRIPIRCHSPIHKVVGGCHLKDITIQITSFTLANCKCIPKTKLIKERKVIDMKHCVNNRWKIIHTPYELRRSLCIRKPQVITYSSIICPNFIRLVDKKLNDCQFLRSYMGLHNVRCRCVPYVIRSVKLNYKCCQKSIVSKKCIKDTITETTTTYYKLLQFKCYLTRKVSHVSLKCNKPFLQRIPTGKCTYKILHFVYLPKRCRCIKTISSVELKENCCIHKKPYRETKCDVKVGRKLFFHYTFQHTKNDVCIKNTKITSTSVNCKRLICNKKVSKCLGNTQTVQMFCHKRIGCNCVKKLVKEYKECCGQLFQWIKRGLCNQQRKYFKLIQYYALKMNIRTKACQTVLIKQQYVRCSCPNSFSKTTCIKDNLIKIVHFSYLLKGVSCQLVRKEIIKTVSGCSKPITTRVHELCNRNNGWKIVSLLIKLAKNCKCVYNRRTIREICICGIAFPSGKEKVYCRNHNVIVTEKRIPHCDKTTVKWTTQKSFRTISQCKRKAVEIGRCFISMKGNSVKIRYDTSVEYYLKNCKCQRRVIKSTLKHCECRKFHTKQQCLHDRIVTTVYTYVIVNGICQQRSHKTEKRIPCPLKPMESKSSCIKNHYIFTKTTFALKNCRCTSLSSRETCDCNCPRNSKQLKCSGNYFFNEITTIFTKKNCRCIKHVSVKRIFPICPRYIPINIGKEFSVNVNNYKIIIKRNLKKNYKLCKCVVEEHKETKVSSCSLHITPLTKCLHNRLINEFWAYKIDWKLNKCVKYIKSSAVKIIKCRAPIFKSICDQKTGKSKETTITYQLKNCKCVPKTSVSTYDCKCDRTPKLAKKGNCISYPTCLRIDTYKHQEISGKRCVEIHKRKPVICCCPRNQNIKRCERNQFVNIKIMYTLLHDACSKKVTRNSKLITCSNRIRTVAGPCMKKGYQLINYYRESLKNCKCSTERIKAHWCRCRCEKDKVEFTCNTASGYNIKTVTKYNIVNCKCQKKLFVTKTLVTCKRDVVLLTNCIRDPKHSYSIITTRRIHYSLDNKCKCIGKLALSTKICACDRLEKIKVICDSKNFKLLNLKSFNVFKNGQCLRTTVGTEKSVFCNTNWRLVGDSGCKPHGFYGIKVLTYAKLVRDNNCKCKQVTKTKQCYCSCSGPSFESVCVKERIHHRKFQYKIINCQCKRIVVSDRIAAINCKSVKPVIGKCFVQQNRCIRTVRYQDIYTINCKCYTRPRVVKQTCNSCIIPGSTNRQCNRVTNKFIITTIRFEVLQNGIIKKNVERKNVEVACATTNDCRQVTACNKKTLTQIFKCTVPYKEMCLCKSKQLMKRYPCECKPRTFTNGKCNRKTCLRDITITRYHLIVLKNDKTSCEQKYQIRKEKCCCPENPKPITLCIRNKLIKTTKTFKFDEKKKTCSLVDRKLDISTYCGPHVHRALGKCNVKTCIQQIHITNKKWIYCRCIVSKSKQNQPCCCLKKHFTEVKCLKSTLITLNHDFSFKNGKCSESVNTNRRFIVCLKPRFHRFRCNLLTRKRLIREYRHVLIKCQCILKIFNHEKLCRCPKTHISRQCIASKGITRTTIKTYSLDEKKDKCIEHVKFNDQVTTCLMTQKQVCTLCNHNFNNGLYKACTTTWKVRQACLCVNKSYMKYHLCNCNIIKPIKQCIQNTFMFKITEFVKAKSLDKRYDSVCVKKEKISSAPQLFCMKYRVVKGQCINSFQKYTLISYIRVSCQCVRQVKVVNVRCSCNPPKVIEQRCVDNVKTRKTTRSNTLICDRNVIPNCRCIGKDSHVDKFVNCPPDSYNQQCTNGILRRTWTINNVHACNCKAEIHTDSTRGCGKTPCSDLLTNVQCNRFKQLGKCKQINIYSQYLCPVTCGYCEVCKPTSIERFLTDCQCKKIVGRNICSRTLSIIRYEPKDRKCVTFRETVDSVCQCTNKYANSVCEKAFNLGQCIQPLIKTNCPYHCNTKCQQCEREKIFHRCIQTGINKGKFKMLKLKYYKVAGACIFKKTITFEGQCKICDTTPMKTINDCMGGKRTVITHYIEKLRDGTCVNKEKSEVFLCTDCCQETESKIGACTSGNKRIVTTVFWANKKGQCIKYLVNNSYNCNPRCNNVKIARTKCVYNRQMIIQTWFSDSNCIPHTIYEVANCHLGK